MPELGEMELHASEGPMLLRGESAATLPARWLELRDGAQLMDRQALEFALH